MTTQRLPRSSIKNVELTFKPCNQVTFLLYFKMARHSNKMVKDFTSEPSELPASKVNYFLSFDKLSGYGVTSQGELIAVYSTVKGRGSKLVADAINNGAIKLDCFDGKLVGFYKASGFSEVKREANWVQGGPDVVYMSLTTRKRYHAIARGLNTSLTPLTDLAILKRMRSELGIDETPRNMSGWSERTTLAKNGEGVPALSLI